MADQKTSEGRRYPVVTNDETRLDEAYPPNASSAEPMTPSRQPGASGEAGIFSPLVRDFAERTLAELDEISETYGSPEFDYDVDSLVAALDQATLAIRRLLGTACDECPGEEGKHKFSCGVIRKVTFSAPPPKPQRKSV